MEKKVKICPICGHVNDHLSYRCGGIVTGEAGAGKRCHQDLERVSETFVGAEKTAADTVAVTAVGPRADASPAQSEAPPPAPAPRPQRSDAPPQARLVYGSSPLVAFPVAPDAIAGRGGDVDLTDIDPGLATSRRHAQFRLTPGGWFVQDLGSTNQTKLNGVQLMPGRLTRLSDGDQLELGGILFFFRTKTP